MHYKTRFQEKKKAQEPKEPVPEAPKSSRKKETKKKAQEPKEPVPEAPKSSRKKETKKKAQEPKQTSQDVPAVATSPDPREQLLNTNIKDLTPDQKKARKAYKQKLLRLKKKEIDDTYNQAEKERMRKKRAIDKKEKEETLKNKNKIKKDNKQVKIITEHYDKQLKELRKQKETVEKEINEPVIIYIQEKKSKKKPDEDKAMSQKKRDNVLNQMHAILKKLPHPDNSGKIGYKEFEPNLKEKIKKLFNEPKSPISNGDLNDIVKRLWFVNNQNIDSFMQRVMKLPNLARLSINTYLTQGWQHVLRELALMRPKQFNTAYIKMKETTSLATVKNTEVRSKNELLPKDEHKKFNYDPQETLKKLKDFNFKNTKQELMFAFYTQNGAPRRLEDINTLRLSDKSIDELTEMTERTEIVGDIVKDKIKNQRISQDKPRESRENYIQMENGIPIKVVFNKYKTDKAHKTQVFPIQKTVQDILVKHIKELNLGVKNRYYIFGSTLNTGQEYNSLSDTGKFGSDLKALFNKVYQSDGKKGITLRWIRISAASYFHEQYSKKKNMRKKIATLMGHDENQFELYGKWTKQKDLLFADDDDTDDDDKD